MQSYARMIPLALTDPRPLACLDGVQQLGLEPGDVGLNLSFGFQVDRRRKIRSTDDLGGLRGDTFGAVVKTVEVVVAPESLTTVGAFGVACWLAFSMTPIASSSSVPACSCKYMIFGILDSPATLVFNSCKGSNALLRRSAGA